jgi:hypothetical protein
MKVQDIDALKACKEFTSYNFQAEGFKFFYKRKAVIRLNKYIRVHVKISKYYNYGLTVSYG